MATAANWFSETIKGKKAAIRDSAVTLKQIRKLVHPARYLQESSREISHRKFLAFSFETALDARDWLLDRVETDIEKRLQEEEPTQES
jgi:hypothetical protein